MDKKQNKIVEFIKEYKKEVAIAGVAGAVGVAVGLIGYKRYIFKNYGELIEAVRRLKYSDLDDGVTAAQHLAWILKDTNSMYWRIPQETMTLSDVLSESALEKMKELGDTPDMAIAGFMVGIK